MNTGHLNTTDSYIPGFHNSCIQMLRGPEYLDQIFQFFNGIYIDIPNQYSDMMDVFGPVFSNFQMFSVGYPNAIWISVFVSIWSSSYSHSIKFLTKVGISNPVNSYLIGENNCTWKKLTIINIARQPFVLRFSTFIRLLKDSFWVLFRD